MLNEQKDQMRMTQIILNEDLIFAEGGRRHCFIFPDDPDKCIKTLGEKGNPASRRRKDSLHKRFRPLSMFDDNLRELKAFRKLELNHEEVWNHFPRCYGLEQTNRGTGIVCDLIRDEDGGISQTVRQYVENTGKTQALLSALEEFFSLLRRRVVLTRDIRP